MSDSETRDRVECLFEETLTLDLPAPDANLLEMLDSLSLVQLLFNLEGEFELDITNDDIDFENFRTVDRIVAYVDAQRHASNEPRTGTRIPAA